jgi:cadmium resistance protein CadD (predicted permease)
MKFIQTTVIRALLGLLILSLPAAYSAQKSKKDNKKKEDKIEINNQEHLNLNLIR